MCQVINLYGGPSTGKSTTAAALFAKMKRAGLKVELAREYAKDLVYDNRQNIITNDQLYIFAKQQRRMKILHEKVDYIITDSPLLLSVVYGRMYNPDFSTTFENLIMEYYNKYDNIDIYITRNTKEHPYQQYGRDQTEDEAITIDKNIQGGLAEIGIQCHQFEYSDDKLVDEIFDSLILPEDNLINEMSEFIRINFKEFKPLAYYDKEKDILHVQLEDCSYSEISCGIFNVFKKNHTYREEYVGFNVLNVSHIFELCDLPYEVTFIRSLVYDIVAHFPKYISNEEKDIRYYLSLFNFEVYTNLIVNLKGFSNKNVIHSVGSYFTKPNREEEKKVIGACQYCGEPNSIHFICDCCFDAMKHGNDPNKS